MRQPFIVRTSESLVNTKKANLQIDAKIAPLEDGGWVVAWQHLKSASLDGDKVKFQRFTADGNLDGEEIVVNRGGDFESIAALLDGGWVITWRSYELDGSAHGVYQQRFSSEGNLVGEEELVNSSTHSAQVNSKVTALADGGWVVVWMSYHKQHQTPDGYDTVNEVFQQRYSALGETVGGEIQVNTFEIGYQWNPLVTALPDGGWLVTYSQHNWDETPGGLYQQRYAANGTPVGENVHFTTEIPVQGNVVPPYSNDYLPVYPDVAVLADGGWVLVWTASGRDLGRSSDGVFQQRFSSDGELVGEEIRVNTYVAGRQNEAQVSALSDGGWVVVWRTPLRVEGQDNTYWSYHDEIAAQRYDANGIPIGNEFTVNSISESETYSPDVELLENGNLVFTWISIGKTATNWTPDVYQTVLAPSQIGTAGDDKMAGGALNDLLYGAAGNDVLRGNNGPDALFGETGDDILKGGRGRDLLDGGEGADQLNGGAGKDFADYTSAQSGLTVDLAHLSRNTGIATGDSFISIENLAGSSFDDILCGDSQDNRILGGRGEDFLRGRAGNDTLIGSVGSDTLIGGTGTDNLKGGAGNDSLRGGRHADVLDGGNGNDILTGGAGNDTFVFSNGTDVLTDFDAASSEEKVDLSGVLSITSFSDLMDNHVTRVKGDVIIDDLNGNALILNDTTLKSLGADDFIF